MSKRKLSILTLIPIVLLASGCGEEPDPIFYTVTFLNYDNSVLFIDEVEPHGTAVYEGEIPTRPNDDEYRYEFVGWDYPLEDIVCSLSVKAEYDKFPLGSGGGGDDVPPTPSEQLNPQEGTILHAWNWSLDNIKTRLPEIKEAGFTSIQTSPMQPQKDYSGNEAWRNGWWKLYQPLGFSVATKNHVLGTKDDLRELCLEADKYDINIIVDVVANHLAGGSSESFHDDVRNYEPVIYNNRLLHTGVGGVSDGSIRQVTKGYLGGYPDIMSEDERVQERVLSLLKEYIDCGVDGFRFDAAKHIETPDDGEYASNFWPYILDGAKEYALIKGEDEPYYYGEILNTPGNGRSFESYTNMMSITDNGNGSGILYAVNNNSAREVQNNLYYRAGNRADRLVLWAESHDTYANDGGGSTHISQEVVDKAYAIQASRLDASSLYFARPSNEIHLGEVTTFSWTSEIVKNANLYHNAFVGVDEYLYGDDNVYVNIRDDAQKEGALIIALGSNRVSNLNIDGHLDDGEYIDSLSGNTFTVSDGKLSGLVGAEDIAILNLTDEPSTNLSISHNIPSYYSNSQTITINANNATSASYRINGGDAISFNESISMTLDETLPYGRNEIDIIARNADDYIEEHIVFYRVDEVDDKIEIYGAEELAEQNIYAWVWKNGSDGQFIDTTYRNGVLSFERNDITHFLLASFDSSVNSPSWGNENRQTNDVSLGVDNVFAYSSIVWK